MSLLNTRPMDDFQSKQLKIWYQWEVKSYIADFAEKLKGIYYRTWFYGHSQEYIICWKSSLKEVNGSFSWES